MEQNADGLGQYATIIKQAQHIAWLKARPGEYAGKYVALDGDRLIETGATTREAHEQARRQEGEPPFIAYISSAYDALFGGW